METIILLLIFIFVFRYGQKYIETLSNKIDPSKYPLFPLEELRRLNLSIKEKNKRLSETYKEVRNLLDNEAAHRRIEINSDYSPSSKSSMKKQIQEEIFTLYLERDYRRKIEANIAILNGESIYEAERQYNDNYMALSKLGNFENEAYKIWLNDKPNSSDWTNIFDKVRS